jgi:hypothetical protein
LLVALAVTFVHVCMCLALRCVAFAIQILLADRQED